MNQDRITWDKPTEEKFQKILEQIPDMVRGIAEVRIVKKAESILREQNRSIIGEKDMIDAFFAETPAVFKDAMKEGMDQLGIDYLKYGYK
jgi:hypothetical protein